MAKVVKSPRFALMALLVVLLSAVFMTTPTPPAYAACSWTNCNTWSSDGNCCNGGRNAEQKRTCCNSSQTSCCTQTRCNTSLPCPI